LAPDFRQKGIGQSLEQPGRILNPSPGIEPINRLRQSENAPDNEAINYNKNSKKPGSDKKAEAKPKPLQRLGKSLGKHKKAFGFGAFGILAGGGMFIISMVMLGPMAVIHAGEYVDDIAVKGIEAVNLARTTRNIAKSTKVVQLGQRISTAVSDVRAGISAAISNTRVGMATTKLVSTSFGKSLAKGGMELTDEGYTFAKGTSERIIEKMRKVGNFTKEVLEDGRTILKFENVAARGNALKSSRLALQAAVKARIGTAVTSLINKSTVLTSMLARIEKVKSLLIDLHPIKKLTKIIKSTKLVGAITEKVTNMKKTVAEFIETKIRNKSRDLAGKIAGKFAKSTVGKAAKAIGRVALRTATTIAKFLPAIGFIASFVFELWTRRSDDVSLNANLNIAAGKAMEIQATASQIKSGDFPTESAEIPDGVLGPTDSEEPGEPAQEIGLFVEANLYRETETVYVPEDSSCSGLFTTWQEYIHKDEDDKTAEQEAEHKDALMNCLDAAGETDESVETYAYDFWDSPYVKHEQGDENYQTHESLTGYNQAGDKVANAADYVPTELLPETYKDAAIGWAKDILNSLIASVIVVSPDMFEEEDTNTLDVDTANPGEIGSIVTVGARAQANSRALSAGGHSYEEGTAQAVAIENTRKQYIQDEFKAKPLLARLFDVSDYKSAVVTLAHNSGWNITDPSIGNQLKNVAKTFAKLPNLIASSFNKMSYAGASGASNFYGFGVVGYTEEDLAALPDYDVAADGVVNFFSEIKQGQLPKVGVEEITSDGRILYKEDTDADKIDISAKSTDLLANGSHNVTLCDDGSFVWEDDYPCYSEIVHDEKEKVVGGKVQRDGDGDAIMEETDVILVGPTSYTTDQLVRAYLLDYPLLTASAAESWKEDVDDADLTDEERAMLSKHLEEAMQDMGISTASGSTDGQDDKAIAEQLLKMASDGEMTMLTLMCPNGQSVRNDFQYIADNGHAHYFNNGNCSGPDTQVTLAEGLMQFILTSAQKIHDAGMTLSVNALVASHSVNGGNHPAGKAVDFGCPAGKTAECQTILDSVGAELGFSAKVSYENYLTDPSSTHAHFSTMGN
jgi:hypothetical protein